MKKRRYSKQSAWLFVLLATFLFLSRNTGTIQQLFKGNIGSVIQSARTVKKSVSDDKLAELTFKSGESAYINVNNGKSDLDPNQWKQNKINYGQLDSLNRTTQNIAFLERRNLVKSNTRTRQVWDPTGWHQKRLSIDGRQIEILNRGHLLAYSVTGKFDKDGNFNQNDLGSLDNPKNLATQTEFSNQRTMQIFEERVRNALAQNKKVIYKVSTVFKGDDLMPIGYHSQAISTDGSLNFNVFIWNVEPGVQFDYKTGRSTVDRNMRVAEN